MTKNEYKQRLDKLTSLLVRLRRDRCCTCGRKLNWKRRQAGHYVPRVVERTRWDLKNVHTQCANCNVNRGGALKQYSKFLEREYGPATRVQLDVFYDLYKQGRLPAYSEREIKTLYRYRLAAVRKLESEPGQYIPKDW